MWFSLLLVFSLFRCWWTLLLTTEQSCFRSNFRCNVHAFLKQRWCFGHFFQLFVAEEQKKTVILSAWYLKIQLQITYISLHEMFSIELQWKLKLVKCCFKTSVHFLFQVHGLSAINIVSAKQTVLLAKEQILNWFSTEVALWRSALLKWFSQFFRSPTFEWEGLEIKA